jgi:lipid II:glycine glycyltransferase (peptidoglycan interpeptide bridge formation enzyme)
MNMEPSEWDLSISSLPGAHVLQTWEWGQVKEAFGWKALPKTWVDPNKAVTAAALVLKRSTKVLGFPFDIFYVPRGPLLDWGNLLQREMVLEALEDEARKSNAVFIKIDPDLELGSGVPGALDSSHNLIGDHTVTALKQRGWNYSSEQIQFSNSVWLDLNGSEQDWLDRMKQKTRYNLHLAQRKGVAVRQGTLDDLGMLYHMYAETSQRDGFVIRPEEYYRCVWQTFMQRDMASCLIAEAEGQPIAGLFLFYFARKAWYLYGMSTQSHREWMPNYLLQWEAMKLAKQLGCQVYDLWGAPHVFNETDSMWGVYKFKEGLGGKVIRTIGAWDFPVKRNLYTLFVQIMPRVLSIMRRRGMAKTQAEVS